MPFFKNDREALGLDATDDEVRAYHAAHANFQQPERVAGEHARTRGQGRPWILCKRTVA